MNEQKITKKCDANTDENRACLVSRHNCGKMPERNRQRYIRLTYLISDYNPAFSGEGAEILKRDIFYNIDQVYDLSVNDSYYKEGNGIAYKIVKGEFV